MALTRADFPKPPSGVSRNNASARGWGPGWPHCQTGKWVKVSKAGVTIYVRREVAEMVGVLLAVTEELGYNVLAGQTWGAACRAIRGTSSPSNHSWGLAVDINSSSNPMQSTFHTNIPPKVVAAWWASGWFWGGWYQNRPDTMHFEYVGTPGEVASDLNRAKAYLAKLQGAPVPPVKVPTVPAVKWQERVNAKPGKRVLILGMVGDDVEFVQRFLGLKVDGMYGPDTVAKVKAYQKMRGIQVDGVVGTATWTPMLSSVS